MWFSRKLWLEYTESIKENTLEIVGYKKSHFNVAGCLSELLQTWQMDMMPFCQLGFSLRLVTSCPNLIWLPLFDEGSFLPPFQSISNEILQSHINATQLLVLSQIVRVLPARHFSYFQFMLNIEEISISLANSLHVYQQSSLRSASTWRTWAQSMALTGIISALLLCTGTAFMEQWISINCCWIWKCYIITSFNRSSVTFLIIPSICNLNFNEKKICSFCETLF